MECIQCQEETSNPKFCSSSCSATFNNQRRSKKRYGVCRVCSKPLSRGAGKYCSILCQYEEKYLNYIEGWLNGTESGHTGANLLSRHVKRWLREQQGDACALCHRTHWKNDEYEGEIPLEGDHINGNSEDSSRGNVRMVCPTCHSLTDTYRGKNKGRGRPQRI